MSTEAEDATLADLDLEHVAGVAVGALLLAGYGSWMAADVVARWLVFLVVLVAGGYFLAQRETTRAKTVYTIYALAAFLVLTPILIVLPDVLSASAYGVSPTGMAFMVGNAIITVLFLVLAALVAYVGYRVDGGRGVVDRVRGRLDDGE